VSKHPIIAAIFVSSGFFLIYLALIGFQGLPVVAVDGTTQYGITGNPLILILVGAVLAIAGLYEIIRKEKA